MRIHRFCICLFSPKKELAFIPTFKGPRAFFSLPGFWDKMASGISNGESCFFSKWQPQRLSYMSSEVRQWQSQLLFQRRVSGGFPGQLHLLSFIFETLSFMNYRPRFVPAGIELFGLI